MGNRGPRALTAVAHAQELVPELQQLSVKYNADITALESQKTAAIAQVMAGYISALDVAEKTASAAGQLAIVASLTKERESANDGKMPPATPADLPKVIQGQRKSCQGAVVRITADFALRRQCLNADYLRVLAVLKSPAPSNSELPRPPWEGAKKLHFPNNLLTTRTSIPATLEAMKRILISIISAGWLLPLWVSAYTMFQFLSGEVEPRLAGRQPINSFPFVEFSSQAFTVACVWLACVTVSWAWRVQPKVHLSPHADETDTQ